MIAYLNGKLSYKDPTFVIIDVGGVGYNIRISLSTYTALKDKDAVQLFTHYHVTADAHTLFGFFEMSERNLFLDLISVSGVGPSTGLMMLSSLSASEIRNAIAMEEVRIIQGVKGIGAKTAQRVILELKDKMRKSLVDSPEPHIFPVVRNTVKEEALTALITLGIGRAAAEKSVNSILKNSTDQITLEELIKKALQGA